VLAAFEALRTKPDLLLCDGQGIAHPRRLDIASHLGVLLDLPSIGCAKSRLTGRSDPVSDARGAHVPPTRRGEVIGRCFARARGRSRSSSRRTTA